MKRTSTTSTSRGEVPTTEGNASETARCPPPKNVPAKSAKKGAPTKGAASPGSQSSQETWKTPTSTVSSRKRHDSTSDPMQRTTTASGSPSGDGATAGTSAAGACQESDPQPGTSSGSRPPPPKRRVTEEEELDHEWGCVSETEVAQWIGLLQIMEAKIKVREGNLKKFRALIAEAKKYAVDFRNPIEWHEEMLAEFPWKARHGRAMTDRQIATSVQPEKLTQRLMAVTRRAVILEQSVRRLERERSALFVSVEGRCLEKAESILEEYSACLTHAPTHWALLREIIRRDGVTPAIARVNQRLKSVGLRLDFHFAPTKPSFGLSTCSRPSTREHWWRVPEGGTIDISSDEDEDEEPSLASKNKELPVIGFKWKRREAAELEAAREDPATATQTDQ